MATTVRKLGVTEIAGRDQEDAIEWYKAGNRAAQKLYTDELVDRTLILKQVGQSQLRFFWLGDQHLTAKVLGDEFTRDCIGGHGVPGFEFRNTLCNGYFHARYLSEPTLDRVNGECEGNWLQYTRLILPLADDFFAAFLHPERILRALP